MVKRLEDIEIAITQLQEKITTDSNIKQTNRLIEEQRNIEESIRESSFDLPSSFIGKVTWFEDGGMTIFIGEKIYNYCGVPRRVFESFKGAGSKGAFFVRNIRGIYEC